MYRLNRLIKSLAWALCSLLVVIGGLLYLGLSQQTMDLTLTDQLLSGNLVWASESKSEREDQRFSSTELEELKVTSEQQTVILVESEDARAKLVANFIERNDYGKQSPLQPYDEYGKLFVQIADEYGLDFRLLPALARKESSFCNSNIGRTYYNCFGYGVPASGITDAGKFSSYEEGIRTVAASLKKNYVDKGLTDPEAIMRKYCPPSAEGSGSWADHLNQWMAEMRFDDKAMGKQYKENIDINTE